MFHQQWAEAAVPNRTKYRVTHSAARLQTITLQYEKKTFKCKALKHRLKKSVEIFQNPVSVQKDMEQGLSCSCVLIFFTV
jgi:hypothetical protein